MPEDVKGMVSLVEKVQPREPLVGRGGAGAPQPHNGCTADKRMQSFSPRIRLSAHRIRCETTPIRAQSALIRGQFLPRGRPEGRPYMGGCGGGNP